MVNFWAWVFGWRFENEEPLEELDADDGERTSEEELTGGDAPIPPQPAALAPQQTGHTTGDISNSTVHTPQNMASRDGTMNYQTIAQSKWSFLGFLES
jgi:hypothetical protein